MKKRILITDDDEFLTSMYKLSLHQSDREITLASDGLQAVSLIDKEQPDLLILDLLMPKMDGFAVLNHIREKHYRFPVIILSNVQDTMDQKKCLELGAKDFYCKSDTDLDGLVEKVRRFLPA